MSDFEKVNPQVIGDRQRPWRAMFRVECTGGNVEDAVEAPATYQPDRFIYAEGDSWFDKFTPLPTRGTNLLDAIRLPYMSVVVDVSKIGSEASEMVSGQQGRQTKAIFDLLEFDAILLSAGGNDLKNLFVETFAERAAKKGDAAWTDEELKRFATPETYSGFFVTICGHIETFIKMRDSGKCTGPKKPPILIHGYDYLQPRNAAAVIFYGTCSDGDLGCNR
jgi:hypothetical protein